MDKVSPSPPNTQADCFQPIGPAAVRIVADFAFRRSVQAVYRLGPRAVAELLAEIICAHDIYPDVEAKLRRYVAIRPETLAITGGDRWPAVPMYQIRKKA